MLNLRFIAKNINSIITIIITLESIDEIKAENHKKAANLSLTKVQTLKWLLDVDWLITSSDYSILTFHWFVPAGYNSNYRPNSPLQPDKCNRIPDKMIIVNDIVKF